MSIPMAALQRYGLASAALALLVLSGCATGNKAGTAALTASAHDGSRVPEKVSPDLYPKGAAPVPEPVVRYGRYTLVSTEPGAEQRDLLSQIINVTIPQSMSPNVHEAMSYVMQRSGYSLCPAQGDVKILYGLPLPASQYQLGPMTLRNTVQILAGPAWQVVVDEVSRSICFEKRQGYERVARAAAASSSVVGSAAHD
ncbi:putative type IV pilus bioproteinsis protein PilL [Pseudomonas caricapapayae]|uniref:Putative type IV pilus bioproteinsis protein PilL n=2 Tax=Pseudomonas caricapapayae TaxID=46678 RepID=A0A3M6FFE7_9PSED|nr:putative type IV pilus bioproteinsis protein PilL [Pseudomonas caricapapayae]